MGDLLTALVSSVVNPNARNVNSGTGGSSGNTFLNQGLQAFSGLVSGDRSQIIASLASLIPGTVSIPQTARNALQSLASSTADGNLSLKDMLGAIGSAVPSLTSAMNMIASGAVAAGIDVNAPVGAAGRQAIQNLAALPEQATPAQIANALAPLFGGQSQATGALVGPNTPQGTATTQSSTRLVYSADTGQGALTSSSAPSVLVASAGTSGGQNTRASDRVVRAVTNYLGSRASPDTLPNNFIGTGAAPDPFLYSTEDDPSRLGSVGGSDITRNAGGPPTIRTYINPSAIADLARRQGLDAGLLTDAVVAQEVGGAASFLSHPNISAAARETLTEAMSYQVTPDFAYVTLTNVSSWELGRLTSEDGRPPAGAGDYSQLSQITRQSLGEAAIAAGAAPAGSDPLQVGSKVLEGLLLFQADRATGNQINTPYRADFEAFLQSKGVNVQAFNQAFKTAMSTNMDRAARTIAQS